MLWKALYDLLKITTPKRWPAPEFYIQPQAPERPYYCDPSSCDLHLPATSTPLYAFEDGFRVCGEVGISLIPHQVTARGFELASVAFFG